MFEDFETCGIREKLERSECEIFDIADFLSDDEPEPEPPAPVVVRLLAAQVSQAATECERLHAEFRRLEKRMHYREVEWGFDHSYGLSQSDWTRYLRLQDELRDADMTLAEAVERLNLAKKAANNQIHLRPYTEPEAA